MRAVLSVLVLLAGLAFASAAAQQTTGDIQGRIVGPTHQPLADVQVSVTSPNLQGARQTRSDARGRFILPSLPAGSYVVALQRIGYGPARFQDLPVRLGSTTSLGDIHLEVQAVEVAEVVVSGAKPVIDPVSAATGASLDASQLSSLPSDRSFQSLLAFAPQANASFYGDGVNIGGSTGRENAYFVDGMDVTVAAGTSMDLPFNFVQEIQVTTGGYEAEYGRALSGVINVVTPSGGNQFHGQVLGFYTGDELRTTPRVGIYESDVARFSRYDLGVSFGGPVRRDRLWYSVAYNPTFARRRESVGLLPDRWDVEVHHRFAGKLSWSAPPGTDVALTLLGDPGHRDGIEPVLPMTTDSLAALSKYSTGTVTVGLAVRQQIGHGAELHLAVSRLRREDKWYPRSGSTDFRSNIRVEDLITNASSGGVFGYSNFLETRTAIRAGVTQLGTVHTIKIGAEYEVNAYVGNSHGGLIVRVADSVYRWFEGHLATTDVRNRIPTLYAHDSWEVTPRVRLNAGLRWESQHISGSVGPARRVPMEIAPRLGVVFQPGEPGATRLFASAGRFYEQVPPLSAQWWNSAGYSLDGEFPQNPLVDSSNGVVLQYGLTPVVANPDLLGQAYDQFGIGFERRLGIGYKLGARGTYRMLRWVIEDGILPGETFYRMGNPGRGLLAAMPRARQRYAALELSLERSTSGPLYVLGSYVLSRNVGNYTGLYGTDMMSDLANSGSQYNVPDAMANAYGLLPNDRTHVFKVAAGYRLRPNVTLGGFLTIASGTPRSEGGQSAYGSYWTFVSPRGSVGRTPAIWSLDLHGAFDLPVAHMQRVRPRFLIDVFNVASPRKPVLYDQKRYETPDRTGVNPNYGAVTGYQPPMSARVGLIVDF